MNKYQIALAILEKLFYAHLFFVITVCVATCLLLQWYDVPAATGVWEIK